MIMMFDNKEGAEDICKSLYEIFGGSPEVAIAKIGHSFCVEMTALDRNTGIWFESGKWKWVVSLRKLSPRREIVKRDMTFKDLLTWYKAEMVKRGKWE